MKYLIQAFLMCIVMASALMPPKVLAMDVIKQSYQTGTLVDDLSTEPIDNRTKRLEQYLLSHNSPMAESAGHFVKEADRLGLDWRLVAAIAGNESLFGWYIPYNSYNGWGWAVWTGTSYGANFQSWEEGITTVSEGLKTDYIDQGLVTVDQIGRKYAADRQWAWKVKHFMDEIEAFNIYAMDERLLALSL